MAAAGQPPRGGGQSHPLRKRGRRPRAALAQAPAAASAVALFLFVLLLVPGAHGFLHAASPRATPVAAARAQRRGRCLGPRFFNPRGSAGEDTEEQQQQPATKATTMLQPLAPPASAAAAGASSSSSSSAQYEELMEKLTDDEKYNILLQSRASSLIDLLGGRGGGGGAGAGSGGPDAEFEPLYRLLEEMTAKGVKLTGKSFATLMDAASLSRRLGVIQACLVQARRNGVCRAFSRDVGALTLPPSATAAAPAATPDALPPVPTDDRSLEVSAGLGALAVVGGALGWEALAPLFHGDTTPASVLLFLVGAAAALDFTQRQGKELRLVLSGLNRLFLRDPEREARAQAAAFLSAYLLGLPCFCFSPSVLEAARLPNEVGSDFRDVLASTAGLHRLLVYLLAPVAAEEANHVQLVASDPRQARALLQLFRERNPGVEVDGEGVVLPWAFQEAKRLLQANAGLLDKLRKRMESGGATVGDCVQLLESAVTGQEDRRGGGSG